MAFELMFVQVTQRAGCPLQDAHKPAAIIKDRFQVKRCSPTLHLSADRSSRLEQPLADRHGSARISLP